MIVGPSTRLPGKLTILSGHSRDQRIRIELTDTSSSCEFVEIEIDPETLIHALTGRGYVDCHFTYFPKCPVGKTLEVKHEKVFIADGWLFAKDDSVRQAVSAFEVDGWIGDDRDAMNHHNRARKSDQDGGTYYTVGYRRYVDMPEMVEVEG